MEIHANIHPKLKYFSFACSFFDLIVNEETAITFLEEINLIPSRNSRAPTCCGNPMIVEDDPKRKLKWHWRCNPSKKQKSKKGKKCRKTKNPSSGTFFEGTQCRIKINEVLFIIICFVCEMTLSNTLKHFNLWRLKQNAPTISSRTIVDYYSFCREIAEVITSHTNITLGGEGKTVQIDKTFLTKRKYNCGRITKQMTINVLGIYCKEDKTGLFFHVNSKNKETLWPYLKKYINSLTSKICTDSAKQYEGVEKNFSGNTSHLKTNHSVGEFVSESDKNNTINDLENQNKLLKKTIKCRNTTKILHQYMALHFYQKQYLRKYELGSKIMQFLTDIKKVYPGFENGDLKEGLFLKELEEPRFTAEEIDKYIPNAKKRKENEEFQRETNSEEDMNNVEEDIW